MSQPLSLLEDTYQCNIWGGDLFLSLPVLFKARFWVHAELVTEGKIMGQPIWTHSRHWWTCHHRRGFCRAAAVPLHSQEDVFVKCWTANAGCMQSRDTSAALSVACAGNGNMGVTKALSPSFVVTLPLQMETGCGPAQTSHAWCIIFCRSRVCPWNKAINLRGSSLIVDNTVTLDGQGENEAR